MRILSLAFLVLLATVVPSTSAATPGLALGRATELRLSGRVVDYGTGTPLVHAEVTVETDRLHERFVADYDGRFSGVLQDAQGLGLVTISAAHGEHRAKTLDVIAIEMVPKNVEATVTSARARIKSKKVDLDLGCGGKASIANRDLTVDVAVVCDEGLVGVEYAKGPNRFAILAAEPFALHVGDGRIELRNTQASTVTLRAEMPLRGR